MPLKGKNELERFVDKYGYNIIWAALGKHLRNYTGEFEVNLCYDFTLADMHLLFTRSLYVQGCHFEFDAIFDVYIGYTDECGDKHNSSRWFSIHCATEVDGELKFFAVSDIAIYEKNSKRGNATQNFVPIISKRQMDTETKKFLRDYFPQALNEPTKVPIYEIACNMGLNLELAYMLSEDFSFFGQITFSDTTTQVLDTETGDLFDLDTTRGTVLIDPEVFWERSPGSENFTIAHEVVHWEKHRLFADIKRLLYKDKYVAHRCPKWRNILTDSNNEWGDEEWLEWQANGIVNCPPCQDKLFKI